MRYLSFVCMLLMLCAPHLGAQQHKKKTAKRSVSTGPVVVVIDPGHGGRDPGAHAKIRGIPVYENVYVYDIALRLQRILRQRGAQTYLTVQGTSKENNSPASMVQRDVVKETFALDGSLVQAGTKGLRKRVAYGNLIRAKHPKQRQVWVSIHFDVVGKKSDIFGVRVIQAGSSSTLGHSLMRSFGKVGRLREKAPLVKSGDERYGIRHLFVLRDQNLIKEKVLIELGNFLNPGDLYRIRDPQVREKYALAIADALR